MENANISLLDWLKNIKLDQYYTEITNQGLLEI